VKMSTRISALAGSLRSVGENAVKLNDTNDLCHFTGFFLTNSAGRNRAFPPISKGYNPLLATRLRQGARFIPAQSKALPSISIRAMLSYGWVQRGARCSTTVFRSRSNSSTRPAMRKFCNVSPVRRCQSSGPLMRLKARAAEAARHAAEAARIRLAARLSADRESATSLVSAARCQVVRATTPRMPG